MTWMKENLRARQRDDLQTGASLPLAEQTRPLISALVRGKWSVALKVHPVVQDAYDFDRALRRCAVDEEVTSTTAAARNVERAKTGHDLVPGLRARNIGTLGKLANRLDERVAIGA
jgi:hypothetical protein